MNAIEQREVETLRQLRVRMDAIPFMSRSNKEAIDAQIWVIENKATLYDITVKYPPAQKWVSPTYSLFVHMAARNAHAWVEDYDKPRPSASTQDFVELAESMLTVPK